MHFYVILRRETGDYVADGDTETPFVSQATRYTTRKKALVHLGPNTCVCGPYPTDEYGG